MGRLARDPRPPRALRRDGSGALYDLDERRPIGLAELGEEVRAGRRFRVTQQGSERDCTQQVLLAVLGSIGPAPPSPIAAGAQLHGLAGAVGAVAGAISDRRSDHREDRTGASGAPGRGAGNGGQRRARPRLEIDDGEA